MTDRTPRWDRLVCSAEELGCDVCSAEPQRSLPRERWELARRERICMGPLAHTQPETPGHRPTQEPGRTEAPPPLSHTATRGKLPLPPTSEKDLRAKLT